MRTLQDLFGQDISVYCTLTGGGTDLIPRFLRQGGASSIFTGAEVPYAWHLTEEICDKRIGYVPNRAVSLDVARALATHSLHMTHTGNKMIGLGCTASLAKHIAERADRKHEFHIAVYTRLSDTPVSQYLTASAVLKQGRYRQHEERILTDLMEDMLLHIVFPEHEIWTDFLGKEERCDINEISG